MPDTTAPNTLPADLVAPVERQLHAYNARDIDTFMACWADDAQYYEFPSRLLASGAPQIRARHVTRFEEPHLHGHLLHRGVVGNTVIDQERVTRDFPEGVGEVDVLAVYEVVDGKIAKAWFKMSAPRLHNTGA